MSAVSEPPREGVAVIGLGSMGLGMATSLLRAGFGVTGCDVAPAAVARLVEAGGRAAPTPAAAAAGAAVVVALDGDSVLLCRRAIEHRRGFWTIPAGYMELGETAAEGAFARADVSESTDVDAPEA